MAQENKILLLEPTYYEIREKLVSKDLEEEVRHAWYYPHLVEWKSAIDNAFEELQKQKFETLNESDFKIYANRVQNQLAKLIEEIIFDSKEVSGYVENIILDDGNPEFVYDKVEHQKSILYGDIIRIIYFSLLELIKRIKKDEYENCEEFFYLNNKYKSVNNKIPQTLKDIWISEIEYEELITFLTEDSCRVCPLIIKDQDGKLTVKPKVVKKYFAGLISACMQQELIQERLGDKKISGEKLANILTTTFNSNFASKYFQEGEIKEMQSQAEKSEYYEPFMNIKTILLSNSADK